MKTQVHNLCMVVAALSAALLSGIPVQAEWSYDFNDGVVPDSLVTIGFKDDQSSMPSPTFSASAAGGYLRLSDSIAPASGGARSAIAVNAEVFPGDVRVSAVINATGTSDDGFGLTARHVQYGNWLAADYWAYMEFGGANGGRMAVAKSPGPGIPNVLFFAPGRVSNLARSYFLELEVSDDPISGLPTITGRLFDQEGGTRLLERGLVDTNVGGTPPIRSGIANAFAWYRGDQSNRLDVAFDNIHAVPEPGTLWLLSTAACGMLARAWRRRRRTGA